MTNDTSKSQSAKSQSAAGKDRTTYVCPMHPDVQQNSAGQCPKCGMALQRQEK